MAIQQYSPEFNILLKLEEYNQLNVFKYQKQKYVYIVPPVVCPICMVAISCPPGGLKKYFVLYLWYSLCNSIQVVELLNWSFAGD